MQRTLPTYFVDAREERLKCCNVSNCEDIYRDIKFNCANCQLLRRKLRRQYHSLNWKLRRAFKDNDSTVSKLAELASAELEARLLYDYVFSMVTLEDLNNGDWIMLKDNYHKFHYRMLYTWSHLTKSCTLTDIIESQCKV